MSLTAEAFKLQVRQEIERCVREHPENRFCKLDGTPMYQAPLVGFIAGNDPIFVQFKTIIGKFHLTPGEALAKFATLKGLPPPDPNAIGVISYVLPISQVTRDENARMLGRPSARWAHTRLFGQEFNNTLQNHLVHFLGNLGHLAVAPEQEKRLFKQIQDKTTGWGSTWSQRHVAFAAGLGTFGLSDGLITAAGKAHRLGSVVVNQFLDSPPRTTDIHRDCVYFQNGGCMECARRCPAGAITEKGHDKNRCGEFVFSHVPFIQEAYGINIYACGLCQCGVPCERRIPLKHTL